MKFNVCYHPATGGIRQIDNAESPPNHDGCECFSLETDDASAIFKITAATHVVDLATLTIREKTASERAAYLAPKDHEIAALVASELTETDQYMMPDRTVENRDDWIAYRQQLRDLSKLPGTASDRLAQFPQRPDGADAAHVLRERAAAIGGE